MARQLVISLVLLLFSQEWERIFFGFTFIVYDFSYCVTQTLPLSPMDPCDTIFQCSKSSSGVMLTISIISVTLKHQGADIERGIIIVKRQINSQSYYDKYHREVTWKFQARPPPLISQQFWLLLVYQPRISSLFVVFYKPPPHLT